MKHIALVVLGVSVGLALFASEKKESLRPAPYVVQAEIGSIEQYAKMIEDVTRDEEKLWYYCQGAFEAAGQYGNSNLYPSTILNFWTNSASRIDTILKTTYPATWYINVLIKQHIQELDAVFKKEFVASQNNIQKTWQRFGAYFKIKGLQEPFAAYRQRLSEQDRLLRMTQKFSFYLAEDRERLSSELFARLVKSFPRN